MAGIYIHIPFCKQACHYCNFHFATSLAQKGEIVDALKKELSLRKGYLPAGEDIKTIYLGGGTPSLLNASDLEGLFNTIFTHYSVASDAEITLEANPDDLSRKKLRELKSTPVNRLSIGIQSFFDEDLRWMNRSHTAEEAMTVLENAMEMGFEKLTADLIFGYPLLSDEKWKYNIETLLQSGVRHLSAYSLTVEKGTPLARFILKGQQKPMDEEQSARQFLFLMDKLQNQGWEQYEISNYAKDGCYSQHNTNYWRNVPYLGLGPSAHSYDGHSRQWNTKVNKRYIQSINSGEVLYEKEILSIADRINEYLMTSLRTMWGISPATLEEKFGSPIRQSILEKCQSFKLKGQLEIDDKKIVLTQEGKLLADHIASELFV